MKQNDIYFTIKKTVNNGYERYRIQKMVDGHQINVVGKTKKEVAEKFYSKLNDLKNHSRLSFNVSKITFADFVHYYLYDVVEPAKAIKMTSFRKYDMIYRLYISDSNLSKTKLVDTTREPLQAFTNNLLRKGLSVATVKQIKTFISTVLNYAVSGDLINKNYAKFVKFPQEEKKEICKFLTDEEICRMIDNCHDYKLKVLILLILNTGLRINEALALTLNDVSFENMTINVDKTLYYYNKKVSVSPPKTASSVRQIPINDRFATILKKYLVSIKEDRFKIGVVVNQESQLFANKFCKLEHSTSINNNLRKLYTISEVNASGFHILRHTFGSKLYESGVDIKTISELMGHSNVAITSNIYIHLSPKKKEEAIQDLDFGNLKT